MCVWVDVSLYPWWCQLAVAVKPASAPPGCGYPGTVGTRSSWHQFCHLISLSFGIFFIRARPSWVFIYFVCLTQFYVEDLRLECLPGPWCHSPRIPPRICSFAVTPQKKVPPTFCIWHHPSPNRSVTFHPREIGGRPAWHPETWRQVEPSSQLE